MSAHGYTSITICVPDQTIEWLNVVARETGRSVENLAEAAVEEAALESAKSRGLPLYPPCPHCDEQHAPGFCRFRIDGSEADLVQSAGN